MLYKRGHRYTLKQPAIRQLLAGTNELALEHDRLLDEGFGWPRVTVKVALSGLATVQATWRLKSGTCRMTHRMVIMGVRLA